MDIEHFAKCKYAATTPSRITPVIREFADELCGGIPDYVPHRPLPFAKPMLCFNNCAVAQDFGLGKPAFGWSIWKTRNLWLNAEYHSVLKTKRGYIDITPTIDSDGRVLFVPDGIKVSEDNIDEVEEYLFSLPPEKMGASKLLIDHPLVVKALATLDKAAIVSQRCGNSDWDSWEKEMDKLDSLLDAYYAQQKQPSRKVLRAKRKAERQRKRKARRNR